MGEFAGELILYAEINAGTCEVINNLLGNSPAFPPAVDANGVNLPSGSEFTGTYGTVASINAYDSSVMSGCFFNDSVGQPTSKKYVFYQVLLAR